MKNISNVLQMLKSIVLVWLITLLLFVAGDGLSNKLKGNLRKLRNEIRGKNKTKKKSFLTRGISFFMKRVTLTGAALSDFWARGREGAFFNRDDMDKAGFNNLAVVLMAVPTPENAIIGVIGKQPAKGSRGSWMKEYIDACAISTWVIIDPLVIAADRLLLLNFNNAVGAAKEPFWVKLMAALQSLLADFQYIANNDKPNAIVILESGNFKIKGMGGKKPQVFTLTNGAVSGEVNLIGEAGPVKKKHLHDWFISYDLGLTWTRFQPTINSETSFSGLTVGATIWFAHQIIDKDGVILGSYNKKSIVVK
jgi:hypothetical protein